MVSIASEALKQLDDIEDLILESLTEKIHDGYNIEHHHSGLAGFTPEQVFTGSYHEVAAQKQRVLDERYARNPERFVRGKPTVPMPPETVAINPILETGDDTITDDRVNFPTLTAAGYVK